MFLEIVTELLYLIVVFAFTLYFHEMAHFLIARDYLNLKVSFKIKGLSITLGNNKDFEKLNIKEALILYGGGFVVGTLFIILASVVIRPTAIFLLIPHTLGSKQDFQNIKRVLTATKLLNDDHK